MKREAINEMRLMCLVPSTTLGDNKTNVIIILFSIIGYLLVRLLVIILSYMIGLVKNFTILTGQSLGVFLAAIPRSLYHAFFGRFFFTRPCFLCLVIMVIHDDSLEFDLVIQLRSVIASSAWGLSKSAFCVCLQYFFIFLLFPWSIPLLPCRLIQRTRLGNESSPLSH